MGLARVLTVELTERASVEVVLDDGTATVTRAFTAVDLSHRLPLLGLRPDTSYAITVQTDPPGASAELALRTDPLPADFPQFDVLTHDPARSEPGYTLLPVKSGGDPGFLVILDPSLEPVWYHRATVGFTDVRPGPDGALWGVEGGSVVRVSLGEGRQGVWHELAGHPESIPVDTLAFHHSVVPQADGSFWALGWEHLEAENHPQSYDPDAPFGRASVADVEVLHVLPDGAVAQRLPLRNLLDPTRLGWDALDHQRDYGVDWSHGNALEVDPVAGSLLIGMRHQDAVIEVDQETGEILWILANHAGWPLSLQRHLLRPSPDLLWPFHQHGPKRLADGGLLLFDNRNVVNTPYDGERDRGRASRVVCYDVDATSGTVSQRWEYGDTATGRLFADSMGDADLLPTTGNVLATFGNLKADGGGDDAQPDRGDTTARIIEFHPDDPDPAALDLRVWSGRAAQPRGWHVYRAERMPTLYPDGVLR
ncbi:MAG: arylsulfate sulfotransferase [Myxococcota bacterium]|jgi:arylsulfate sulfotransferase